MSAESIGKTAFLGVAWPRDAKPIPSGAAGNTVDQNRLKPCRGRPVCPMRNRELVRGSAGLEVFRGDHTDRPYNGYLNEMPAFRFSPIRWSLMLTMFSEISVNFKIDFPGIAYLVFLRASTLPTNSPDTIWSEARAGPDCGARRGNRKGLIADSLSFAGLNQPRTRFNEQNKVSLYGYSSTSILHLCKSKVDGEMVLKRVLLAILRCPLID